MEGMVKAHRLCRDDIIDNLVRWTKEGRSFGVKFKNGRRLELRFFFELSLIKAFAFSA
jgi:hypothetical protein